MADIRNLLADNYDSKHGVVNVRPVVDELMREDNPVGQALAIFNEEPRWRGAILEAVRVLAASGKCDEKGAEDIINATDVFANESGTDEYFKSINALATSARTTPALVSYVEQLLTPSLSRSFERRLIFYTIGMLLEHKKSLLENREASKRFAQLKDGLESVVRAESSVQLKQQFQEVLANWSRPPTK
jgi:hypothetical protein